MRTRVNVDAGGLADWTKESWDMTSVTDEAGLEAWLAKLGLTVEGYLASAAGQILLQGGGAPPWLYPVADRYGIAHA